MLTIMGHSDDAELWAGGALSLHARAGGRITIVVPGSDEVRAREAAVGAEVLGGLLYLIDHLTKSAVHDLLAELQPEVVVTHHPDDIHPEHQRAARTVLAALPEMVIATGYPRRVYTCDGYNNLDCHGRALHLPVIVDVTSVWETKMQALTAHMSQPIADYFAPMVETLGRLHGSRVGVRYAEAFAPVPILGRLPATAHL